MSLVLTEEEADRVIAALEYQADDLAYRADFENRTGDLDGEKAVFEDAAEDASSLAAELRNRDRIP